MNMHAPHLQPHRSSSRMGLSRACASCAAIPSAARSPHRFGLPARLPQQSSRGPARRHQRLSRGPAHRRQRSAAHRHQRCGHLRRRPCRRGLRHHLGLVRVSPSVGLSVHAAGQSQQLTLVCFSLTALCRRLGATTNCTANHPQLSAIHTDVQPARAASSAVRTHPDLADRAGRRPTDFWGNQLHPAAGPHCRAWRRLRKWTAA